MDINRINNLWDILENNKSNFPHKKICYVRDDGSIQEDNYANLYRKAKSLLGGLHETGLKDGDKVILALDKNEEIIPLLWACIAGKIIPTILQPPVSFSQINPAFEKIIKVYDKLEKPSIIVSEGMAVTLDPELIPEGNVIPFNSIKERDERITLPQINDADIAYIQFSSGSTGDPKGIILTHRNIVKNIAAISRVTKLTPDDICVSWMPLYHDMGLIGFHFTAAINGINFYCIDPMDFIKKPYLWLDKLSDLKASITGCPNFGQVVVIRHLLRKDHGDWDFSGVRVLYNGAEPISPSIMYQFMELMEPHKFKPTAMLPVYGMAEATLAVTFSAIEEVPLVSYFDRKELQQNQNILPAADNDDRRLPCVSVGKAIDDCSIRIVDESGGDVKDMKVGQVQVKGENVSPGYYQDQEATNNTFVGEWLNTGDMGFIYKGNLYITGRYKDIIFLRGQNLYAHDLEALACKIEEVNYGKIVIAGIFDEEKGQDKIIVFLVGAINKTTIQTFHKLKKLMRETLAITIDVFVPVKSNEIPKTSSGKIQRYKLVSRYLKGDFNEPVNKIKNLI